MVVAPSGELVPAKIVQQPDGDFKVEYSSKFTGRHTVEILYAGQAIMGSPFYVEIYDPNKIKVLGAPNSHVGQRVEFESKSLHPVKMGHCFRSVCLSVCPGRFFLILCA